jgi:hypothetical protein
LKKKRRAKLLTGYTLHLQTFNGSGQLNISYIDNNLETSNGDKPSLLEVYNLLFKVQLVFPNIFITSNRAEQFNSVHDREVTYRGKITPGNANKRLKSWILYKYYTYGLELFLARKRMTIPYSILKKTDQLQIKEVMFL